MKYIFLDFGNVICYPTTGEWFVTPYFDNYLKTHHINKDDILKHLFDYREILDRKYNTLEEEVIMYYDLYKSVFNLLGYNISEEDILYIARDITYSTDKYQLFDHINEELEELKNKYELILLTDNWPCGERLMKIWNLDKYFLKMYISSYYGIKKDNIEFFKIPMDEYNIDHSDITFVDDSDIPLETATSMGIKALKMDRFNQVKSDKYPVINNLFNI